MCTRPSLRLDPTGRSELKKKFAAILPVIRENINPFYFNADLG